MCRLNSMDGSFSAADESLLVYCKPVELYNILRQRAFDNPTFLRRCLKYKLQAKRKRSWPASKEQLLPMLKGGIVIFNYKDYNNMLQKTEVTEDFSCPFCLMQCASFKGLRYHLCSSHDLFNFEFWVTEELQAVNVSVKLDLLRSEIVASEADLQLETFFFCSKPLRRRPKNPVQDNNIQFLELDSSEMANGSVTNGFLEKDDGGKASKSVSGAKRSLNGWHGAENHGADNCSKTEVVARIATGSNGSEVSTAMARPPLDPEYAKPVSTTDPTVPPLKARKLTIERSESRNRMLLLKRQFYHSHRVQPMGIEEIMSDKDSEDEVDDDVAELEDRRMLDDFVDVDKHEKQFMHLWNTFVRKQRVIADGHVPWSCEAFSKLHAKELIQSPPLFWCWRLFMIKLWKHGLLDANSMNTCNTILHKRREEGSDATKR